MAMPAPPGEAASLLSAERGAGLLVRLAQEAGVLTDEEAARLRALDEQIMELINVDDFDGSELGTRADETAGSSAG